jgi:hypothetical protein
MHVYPSSYMTSDRLRTSALYDALMKAANPLGGWSYLTGKLSRIEPTCWALLGTGLQPSQDPVIDSSHSNFLARCQRSEGWLVEDAHWPVNVGFNALAAFTWLTRRDLATDDQIRLLVGRLVAEKGVQLPQTTSYRQDNSLQGWAWLDTTFSWVEPTAWGALALHKAIRAGMASEDSARTRIADAERVLIDRCCRDGGWNYGNANVLGQDLFPHVPTTAIALLALQTRREEPAVVRSLSYLESHWAEEQSALALGLSSICLRTYRRPVDEIERQLLALEQQRLERARNASDRGETHNLHARAVALTALSLNDHDEVFRI